MFIGAMDENGFAVKSEKLKINDRILACNGVDFTKDPYRGLVHTLTHTQHRGYICICSMYVCMYVCM